MKKVVSTIFALILILSSFSVFGVTLMNHNAHNLCPFAVMSSTDCQTATGVFTSAFHHTTGFKALTEVLPTTGVFALLALLLAVILSFFGRPLFSRTDFNQTCYRFSIQRKLSVSILNPVIRWIGLYNKRVTHPSLT